MRHGMPFAIGLFIYLCYVVPLAVCLRWMRAPNMSRVILSANFRATNGVELVLDQQFYPSGASAILRNKQHQTRLSFRCQSMMWSLSISLALCADRSCTVLTMTEYLMIWILKCRRFVRFVGRLCVCVCVCISKRQLCIVPIYTLNQWRWLTRSVT